MTTRTRDPHTSHEADTIPADALSDLQTWIVAALTTPRTDNELVALHLQAYFYREVTRRATPQRIRTARKELELQGRVRYSGYDGLTEFGRKTQRWVTT
ncbi:hypothetical protein E3T46_07850 [Cryobacterium sp. Hh11]|uniref:hypothetical protein n=1 Tax=Cryobacterium sp. Hh11 TaxID=2555868 RepID=UPI00106A793B|nr:hypothetical protein [Cryobacterium sp. Hh11]TFD51993.1 hypothetical protein E3T46_07850 [Cryobacterium sp. Hh11]